MKSLNPIGRGKVCLKKEGANDIIESAKNTFSFTILLRGIGARHAEMDSVGEKEGTCGGVVKLTTVITLHAFNGAAKLSSNISKEMCNSGKRVGFKMKRESPHVMGVIIKNDKVIFKTRHTG
jgi:hypothetical protein